MQDYTETYTNYLFYTFVAANILVSDTGDIKLTGFGTAADVTSSTDRLNAFVGTPLWMAPEVIANATLDTKVS